MELFLIKSYKHLSLYKKEWSAILAFNENINPYIEHEFIYNWWSQLASEKHIEIYGVRENMKVIAFFPFEIMKRYGIVMMKLLNIEESPYMDFVVKNRDLERLLMFVLDGILLNKKEVVFHIDKLDENGATSEKVNNYLKARSLKSMHKVEQHTLNIEEDTIKNREKLEALGTLKEDTISLSNLESLLKLNKNKYYLSKTFNPNFLKQFEEAQCYQIRILKLEEEVISFSVFFLCRGNYLEYANGYLKEFKIFQPQSLFTTITLFQYSTTSIKFSSKSFKGKFGFITWNQRQSSRERKLDKNVYKKFLQKKHTILIAELTDSSVKAPTNQYKEITNEEIRSAIVNREEKLYFYWHDFKGYYANDIEKAFWVNTDHLIIHELHFEKSLSNNTLYVLKWEKEKLESILHFIQSKFKPKHIVVHVNKSEKKLLQKLALFGFMIKEKHVISSAKAKESY